LSDAVTLTVTDMAWKHPSG